MSRHDLFFSSRHTYTQPCQNWGPCRFQFSSVLSTAEETRPVEVVMNGPSPVRLESSGTMPIDQRRHAEGVWQGRFYINKLQAKHITAQTPPNSSEKDTATQTADAVTVDLTNEVDTAFTPGSLAGRTSPLAPEVPASTYERRPGSTRPFTRSPADTTLQKPGLEAEKYLSLTEAKALWISEFFNERIYLFRE